jgi:hypothetical protein
MNGLFVFIFVCFFFNCLGATPSHSSDFTLLLKESLLNKAIASKKNWEFFDKKAGVHIKLSDLHFVVQDGFIVGKMNLDKYEQKANFGNPLLDSLTNKISQMNNLAVVELKTEVKLSDDKRKLSLQHVRFTKFDNKYLPSFLENGLLLDELNRRFSKEINGRVVYEFPKESTVEINSIDTVPGAIRIDGNLVESCFLE